MTDHETTLRKLADWFSFADEREDRAACLAGADALRRGTWQPIDSAPKNGAKILVWAEGIRFPVVFWTDHDISWWHVTDGKHGPWPLRGASPTHWMPLPDAPTEPTR